MSRIQKQLIGNQEPEISVKEDRKPVSHVRQSQAAVIDGKDRMTEDPDLPMVKEKNPATTAEASTGRSVQRLFGTTGTRLQYYAPDYLLEQALPAECPITTAIDLLLKYLGGLQICLQQESSHLVAAQQLKEESLTSLHRQWEIFNKAREERNKSFFKFRHKKNLAALQSELIKQINGFHSLLNRLSVSLYPAPETVPVDQALQHCGERLSKSYHSHEKTLEEVKAKITLCKLRLSELVDQYFEEAEQIDSQTWELCLANQQIYELHWQIINFIKDLEPEIADKQPPSLS